VVRYRPAVKSALPWVASLLAAILLVTPTYGTGLVLAPLTLIGTWVAMVSLARESGSVQAGAVLNLLLLVVGLSLLTLIWWPEGWPLLAIAWALLVAIVLLVYAAVFRRGQAGKKRSGLGTRAV
jgi:hypothetical protein